MPYNKGELVRAKGKLGIVTNLIGEDEDLGYTIRIIEDGSEIYTPERDGLLEKINGLNIEEMFSIIITLSTRVATLEERLESLKRI